MTNGKQGPVLTHDFENYVGYWICMASRAFERAMNEQLAPSGITYRQCQVLAWLAIDGNLSQTDLADRLRIEPPTLVGILDRMEREGWVRRESDLHDRRRKLVAAMPKALPVWSKIVACSEKVRARGNQGVSPAEQELLKNVLRRIIENLPQDRKQEPAADIEPIARPNSRRQKSPA
jgi:MarR family transcriptional regulator, transcriptional regulator for hemolysin